MDSIDHLQRTDLPDLAELFQKVFRNTSTSLPPALAPYFEKIYLENPWRDESISSLVYKRDGRISGFLGVIPFPMTMKGKQIRAAIGGNFMIDPSIADPFAGPRLLKMYLSGPQDLSYTDTATDQGKKMLEGLGSTAIPIYSMQWLRVIRPTEFTFLMGSRNKVIAPLAILAKPATFLIDRALAAIPTSPFHPEKLKLHAEELSAGELLNAINRFSSHCALTPAYTEESLTWLLQNAAEKKEYGPLRQITLFSTDHELQGWFLYYPNAGKLGQVLQIGATARTAQAVLSHLFTDARERGSLALTGRMEPRYISAFSALNCIYLHRNSSVVVHSNDLEIVNVFHRGDAFFTRLEGEWWTRLQGDSFTEDE
jgi:hypothetical protein